MTVLLILLLSIGAGIIGGVFFAFSTFVMRALAQLPAAQGIAAMQHINVVVLNPLFLTVFMGAALLSVICIGMAMFGDSVAQPALLTAASVSYLVGSFGVTIVCNVPRNDRLARFDATSSEAANYWSTYLREWCFWNHLRTAASIAAAVLAALSLAG